MNCKRGQFCPTADSKYPFIDDVNAKFNIKDVLALKMTDVANIVLPSIHKVHFSTQSYQKGHVQYLNVSEKVHDF